MSLAARFPHNSLPVQALLWAEMPFFFFFLITDLYIFVHCTNLHLYICSTLMSLAWAAEYPAAVSSPPRY